MNARLSLDALLDVFDAADWYDRQSPGTGARFEAAVNAFVAALALQPRMYGRVRRPPRGREIRQGTIRRFPYLGTYEIIAGEVVVLSVTHARSRQQPWRRRRP